MDDFLQSYRNWIFYAVVSLGCVLVHVLGIGSGRHGHGAAVRSQEGSALTPTKEPLS